MRLSALLSLVAISSLPAGVSAGDRPNILWITSEDNAAHWLGCYGNDQARTPRLDALAQEGILFRHAYANAPVCAVARCTILTGVYAPALGTQHMRSRPQIPSVFQPYVTYLRQRGYYCTNNAKTDYNFQGDDASWWDACSGKAHYRNRPEGTPFFAVFNLTVSHESSLFPEKVEKNRRRGTIPPMPEVHADAVIVPPHVPDLPEVRSDFAVYHDVLTALDQQVGQRLDELESAGLADDTIVFYYADHGGPTPRSKRYLKDTGVRIPLIVRVPAKWQQLSPFPAGGEVTELVSFVDLAPTILSLCGLDKPPQMQGRAFLGQRRVAPPADPVVFLYADRFDEIYGMRRGITDGRFKYIRRFTPHLPAAPYSYYQFSMPSWKAFHQAWKDGKLSGIHQALWEAPQVVEELFDTQRDPWEVHNVAEEPVHADRLAAMRQRLCATMIEIGDTGLIPEPMFFELTGGRPIWYYVHSDRFDLERILRLAFVASSRKSQDLPVLVEAMASEDPVVRYWGTLGCLVLGADAAPAATHLEQLLGDSHAANRVTAAHALFAIGGREQGTAAVIAELNKKLNARSLQLVINTLTQMNALDEIPDQWIVGVESDDTANAYLKRFAKRLAEAREQTRQEH